MFATSNKIGDYFILDRYLRIVLSTQCSNADLSKRGKYNFRCNICKDSQKSVKKKRAWLLAPKQDKPAMFKCFNGCDAVPAEVWLKTWFPVYYREYIKECLKSSAKHNPSITDEYLREQEFQKKKISSERSDVKYFIPILKATGPLADAAMRFCTDRKIPDNIWKSFFVCEQGKYAERMIIPFFDSNRSIYYYQGRTLTDREPKYLNRSENKEDSMYNIYNIDPKKPVIVLEGPVDSMFVENSVAVLGLDFSEHTQQTLMNLNCYYLLDNDAAGKKASLRLLKEGRNVFLWSRFAVDYPIASECKDINDLVLKTDIMKFDFAFFAKKKWWGTSIYDSVYL